MRLTLNNNKRKKKQKKMLSFGLIKLGCSKCVDSNITKRTCYHRALDQI